MAYTGVKKVRKHNTAEFIEDFKRLNSFVVFTKSGFYEIKKSEIWKAATDGEIFYYLTDKLYVRKRTTMVLL